MSKKGEDFYHSKKDLSPLEIVYDNFNDKRRDKH